MKRCLALFLCSVQLFFASATMAAPGKKLVATLPPLYSMLLAVNEGSGNRVELLLPEGADPHHFSLKPSQVEMLAQADTVYYVSRATEVFLRSQIEQHPQKYVALFDDGKGSKYLTAHGWLSPYRMLAVVNKLDAKNSPAYAKKLQEKTLQWQAALKFLSSRRFMADTHAMDAFAEAFDLQPVILNKKTLSQPQAAQQKCVVVTHGDNPLADKFAKATGAHLVHVDLLGRKLAEGTEHYFQLMDALVRDISECLT